MPRIVDCGGRQQTFDRFQTAYESAGSDSFPILLVDSEDLLLQRCGSTCDAGRVTDGFS